MLCEQGYTYLPIHTEDDLVANLRAQLERLNSYQFSDSEWDRFFKDIIASPNNHIVVKTRRGGVFLVTTLLVRGTKDA